jgi:hypothetical protein
VQVLGGAGGDGGLMFKVKVNIEGDEELLSRLADAPRIVRQELKNVASKSLLDMQSEITDYPPQPEGTLYKRTGLYGRKWLVKVESAGATVEGTLGTNLKYAPYVRGPWQPKWMRHWKHLLEIVEEALPNVERLLEQAGQKIAERLRR